MGVIKDRMVEDLRLKGYAAPTKREYIRCARHFVAHFMKAPTELGAEDVRAFLVSMIDDGKSPSVRKMYIAAIKFLYEVTLRRPDVVAEVSYPKIPVRLPEILAGTEVVRIFGAMTALKYQVAAMTIYATGLRVKEVCALQVGDIDSKRMIVRVCSGKGNRDRYTMLSEELLRVLRSYWRTARPEGVYLFPGRDPNKAMSPAMMRSAIRKASKAVGVTKRVTPHTLRHTFATHMLAMGADIRQIQLVLGHRSIQTTTRYTHMSKRHITAVCSPLDVVGTKKGAVLG